MKKIFVILIVILIIVIINFYINKQKTIPASETNIVTKDDKQTKEITPDENKDEEIIFHIKGAIKNPGVYKLPYGSYLQQAIDLAGGVNNGDVSCLNLAQLIIPYQEIIIPNQNECEIVNQTNNSQHNLININTADLNSLTTISGIGKNKAQAIIEYRKNNPFTKLEDLTNVEGISEKLFNKIRDKITL